MNVQTLKPIATTTLLSTAVVVVVRWGASLLRVEKLNFLQESSYPRIAVITALACVIFKLVDCTSSMIFKSPGEVEKKNRENTFFPKKSIKSGLWRRSFNRNDPNNIKSV